MDSSIHIPLHLSIMPHKYQKWVIAAVLAWVSFLGILFGEVVKSTSIHKEYACTVEKFVVDPRFDCNTRCSVMAENEIEYAVWYDEPDCKQLEKDTLDWYSPKLCLKAKWGFEDPLCPPESSTCYVGEKWRRKCSLSCPLAYNIKLRLNVDHIGTVDKERDLGTDRKKYESYRDNYHVGDNLTCQVVKVGNGDDKNHDVLWLDERVSSNTIEFWKWFMFTGSIMATLFTTLGAIASFVKYRNRRAQGYGPVDADDTAGGI